MQLRVTENRVPGSELKENGENCKSESFIIFTVVKIL
jgi:hypothetical protein